MSYYLIVSALVFAFLTFIWSTKTFVNTGVKVVLLAMTVWTVYILLGSPPLPTLEHIGNLPVDATPAECETPFGTINPDCADSTSLPHK